MRRTTASIAVCGLVELVGELVLEQLEVALMLVSGVRSSWETVETSSVRTRSISPSWVSTVVLDVAAAQVLLGRAGSAPTAISRISSGPSSAARAVRSPSRSRASTRETSSSGPMHGLAEPAG